MPSPRRLLKEEEEEEEETEAEEEEEEEEEAETEPEEEGEEETEYESVMDQHSIDSDDDSCATVPDEAWMDTGMRGVEESETIADLRRQGLPINFTSGKFKGVGLRAIKGSPKGQGKCVCAHGEEGERKWMVAGGEGAKCGGGKCEGNGNSQLTFLSLFQTAYHQYACTIPFWTPL